MASTWLSGVKAVAQSVAGALPALLLVIFAGMLSLLGLACDHGRRAYALAYADRFIDLAAVLVGRPQGPWLGGLVRGVWRGGSIGNDRLRETHPHHHASDHHPRTPPPKPHHENNTTQHRNQPETR